jgi:DNA-binding Xre family transcriptional regulator
MALTLKVQDIARKLGIENAAQLANLTGLGLTSCYQLWEGTAQMISLKTLNTLCNKLKAHPALLFDYTPDPEGKMITAAKQKDRQNRFSSKRSRSTRKPQ